MTRFWRHLWTGLAACGGITVLASACVHNDSSFFLRGVLAPPQSSATSGCIFTADSTQAEEPDGVFDVGVANEYFAEFLAGNQIIPQGNQDQLQTETSRIEITGAIVRVVDLSTGDQLTTYTDTESGFVDPSNGTTPGFGPVGFMVVDPTTSAKLLSQLPPFAAKSIVSYVTAFGNTLGGDYVESNEFGFKITACNGCLVEYTTVDPITCDPAVVPTTMAAPLCYVGEDVPFDCHRCIENPICKCGQETCP